MSHSITLNTPNLLKHLEVLSFISGYRKMTAIEMIIASVIYQEGMIMGGSDLAVMVPYHNSSADSYRKHLSRMTETGFLIKIKMDDKSCFDMMNNDFESGCLFCGCNNLKLDEHHYPVRKVNGGKDTIPICPNCHRVFHQLTDYGVYDLSLGLREYIDDFMSKLN